MSSEETNCDNASAGPICGLKVLAPATDFSIYNSKYLVFGYLLVATSVYSALFILYERVSAVAPLPQRVWGQLANNHTPIRLIPKV